MLEIKEHIEKKEKKEQQMLENIIKASMDEPINYSDIEFTDEQIAAIRKGKCLSCDNNSEDPNMWEDKYKNV